MPILHYLQDLAFSLFMIENSGSPPLPEKTVNSTQLNGVNGTWRVVLQTVRLSRPQLNTAFQTKHTSSPPHEPFNFQVQRLLPRISARPETTVEANERAGNITLSSKFCLSRREV